MAWAEERKMLEVLIQTPATNSPFKKKLAIINRMRNITSESLPSVIQEVKSENLQRFYIEIVNSLLSNTKTSTHDDVHNIVRVIYLYSYDRAFMTAFIAASKKGVADSWVNGALLAEAYFQLHGQLDAVLRQLIKASGENMPQLMNYILRNFENIDVAYIEKKTRGLLENVTERNIEALAEICTALGWNMRLEAEGGYVEVIKAGKDEFEFYRKTPGETSEKGHAETQAASTTCDLSASDLKRIEQEPRNTAFLGAVAVRISGNPDLVEKVLKKAKNVALAPTVACIISQLSKGRGAAISQVLVGDYDSIPSCDLTLIGEMYKFGVLRSPDVVALLAYYLKTKNVEKLCTLLESAGRHMLLQKETNRFARELLARLEHSSWQELERLRVNDCLSRIYRPGGLEIDIVGFFQWFFRRGTFSTSGLFEAIKTSKRLLHMLFAQPELFEDESLLAEIIRGVGMETEMAEFYVGSLEPLARRNRHAAFRVAETLAALLEQREVARQAEVLERVWGFHLPVDVRCGMVLVLLEHSNHLLHGKYISVLSWANLSTDSHSRLFNFCEKHNYEELDEDNGEFDSFEKELIGLRED